MAEHLNDLAAQAASAQKPQPSLACEAIRETVPWPLRQVALDSLANGVLKPCDFLPDPSAIHDRRKHIRRNRVGRPVGAQRPFPTTFPAGSGITYENLYDSRTATILEGCVRRLRESGVFHGAELDDKRMYLMEELPFMMQGFRPDGNPESRYKFASTALGNRVTWLIRQRNAELRQHGATVSLNECINGDGELMDALDERECPELCVRDRGLAAMECLEQLDLLVRRLDGETSLLILMKHVLGLKHETIASRLGLSRTAIARRLKAIPDAAKSAMREGGEA